MMDTEYKLLGIALAGAYLEGTSHGDKTSCTTYDTHLERYYGRLVEGGIVIDKRPCGLDTIYAGVMRGPLVDVTLSPGTVKRFSEIQRAANPLFLAGLLQSGWGPLLAHGMFAEPIDDYGSLDTVSLDLYIAYWGSRGARIGYRKGTEIHWTDGQIETIKQQ